MGRSPFVQPLVTKLYLAEGARKILADLKTQTEPRKASDAELAEAAILLAEAEEDGYWFEAKHELNAGETADMQETMRKTIYAGERVQLDGKAVTFAKINAYLGLLDGHVPLGWNLPDPDGQIVPPSAAAVRNLSNEHVQEIREAIEAHEDRITKARADRKNAQATPSA